MSMTCTDDGHRLSVAYGPAPLLDYVYRPDDVQLESPRPYFHPVRTLGGETISLYRPHDHVWHKGIAWSLPVVGPHNFWGGPNYVHEVGGYVQQDNDGSMDHDAFTDVRAEDDLTAVAQRLTWHTQRGDAAVTEARAFTARVLDDASWALTFTTAMTNISGDSLDIGSPTTKGRDNAGYGGLFWRGPRDFTGGTVLAPDFAGGEELRGQHHPWVGFTGQHDGTTRRSSIVMVDHRANPGHEPQWFVRNEWFAAMCPAPFFSQEVPFPDGETLTFRYAVVIHDGELAPTGAAQLAARGRNLLEQDGGGR